MSTLRRLLRRLSCLRSARTNSPSPGARHAVTTRSLIIALSTAASGHAAMVSNDRRMSGVVWTPHDGDVPTDDTGYNDSRVAVLLDLPGYAPQAGSAGAC